MYRAAYRLFDPVMGGAAMRKACFGLLFSMSTLVAPLAKAASCPNLTAHPGISTIYVQSDFGEKDAASKIYVSGLNDAIKKSTAFCPVEDLRAAMYALDVAGVDISEDHDRAALSVVLVSEKGTLMTHWVRMSSIDNVEKNAKDDVTKVERAVQKAKRH
jgi:hypothetical protein